MFFRYKQDYANISRGFEHELQFPTNIADKLENNEKVVFEIEGTQARQVEGCVVEMNEPRATHPLQEGERAGM